MQPNYYRGEFEGWISNVYDLGLKILMLGHEKLARDKVLEFVKGNPKKIVDLCSGTGSLTLRLKKKFKNAEIYGIDWSQKMLRIAEKKSAGTGIIFSRQNIEKMDFLDDSMDLITVSLGLHEMPKEARDKVIPEIYRILKKGGELVIFDYKKPERGIILKAFFNIFIKLFEPYAKEFISQSAEELLKPSGFKNITEKGSWKFFRFIRGEK